MGNYNLRKGGNECSLIPYFVYVRISYKQHSLCILALDSNFFLFLWMQCEGLKNLIFRDIPYVGHKK